MFTYVLPMVIRTSGWSSYFKIDDEHVFQLDVIKLIKVKKTHLQLVENFNPRFYTFTSDDGLFKCDCAILGSNIIVRTSKRITYVAGTNSCEGFYGTDCDLLLIPAE